MILECLKASQSFIIIYFRLRSSIYFKNLKKSLYNSQYNYQLIYIILSRDNKKMKSHLCALINYQQNNQSNRLSMAEFVIINKDSASTKLFLFFVLRSLYLYTISFKIMDFSNIITCEEINKKKKIDISKTMYLIQKSAQELLTKI